VQRRRDLALEVAALTSVAAIASEEPASVLMTGIPEQGHSEERPTLRARRCAALLADPQRYYTTPHQDLLREKIGEFARRS
jgi:hypothetical protein